MSQRSGRPKRLYKFMSERIALKVMEEKRLKIATFLDMNDPFELAGVRVGNEDAWEELLEHFQTRVGALCFSTSWRSPLMWTHYADNHKGICLGFDVAGVELHTPSYVTKLEDLRVAAADVVKDPTAAQKVFMKILTTKFKKWSYEKEVRAFVDLEDRDPASGFYFYALDDHVRLVDARLGVRCPGEVTTLSAAQAVSLPVHHTRLSRRRFEVVKDEPNGARRDLAARLVRNARWRPRSG